MRHNLEILGLSEQASSVYIFLLEIGPTDISSLVKRSNRPRSSVVLYLQELEKKGLVHQTISGRHKLWHPLEPKKLKSIAQRETQKLVQAIPYLETLQASRHNEDA